MSEMVERVANAIIAEASKTNTPQIQSDVRERLSTSMSYARRYARAAILAMLEPTEAMLRVGPANQTREIMWRRMIGKALE